MITLLLFHSPFIRQIFTWRSSAPDTMSGIVGWNAAQLTPRSWPCTKKKKSGLQNQKKWFFISITQSNGPMDHAHGYKRCLWFSLHVKKTQGTAPLRFDHESLTTSIYPILFANSHGNSQILSLSNSASSAFGIYCPALLLASYIVFLQPAISISKIKTNFIT